MATDDHGYDMHNYWFAVTLPDLPMYLRYCNSVLITNVTVYVARKLHMVLCQHWLQIQKL